MKKFDEFERHLAVLKKAPQEDLTNEFILSGIIDKFYIQFELGWKVLKQLLIYEGNAVGNTASPREIIKASYACFPFIDENLWLSMLKDRNDTTHIYNADAAKILVQRILTDYIPLFTAVESAVNKHCKPILDEL